MNIIILLFLIIQMADVALLRYTNDCTYLGVHMQKKQRATIQNIADIVGVSKTTVSRYLNNKLKYMSAETKPKSKKR